MLEEEAQRRLAQVDYSTVYLMRQHIREIKPADINNLLRLIYIAIKLETFTGDDIADWGIIELLNSQKLEAIDINLLMQMLQQILDYDSIHESSLEFAESCSPYLQHSYKYFAVLLPAAMNLAYSQEQAQATKYLKLCLRLNTKNLEALRHLAVFYQNSENYTQGIETAKLCFSLLTH